MKLELIKRYEIDNIHYPWSCIALNEDMALVLATPKEKNQKYVLLSLGLDEIKYLPMDYLTTDLEDRNDPVLFSMEQGFGIIKSPDELFYYANTDSKPERIAISTRKLFQQVLPPRTRLAYASPVSNTHILPVCFEHTIFGLGSRHFALLNFDEKKRSAKWESWANLDQKQMPVYSDITDTEPPKIDSVMLKDNDVYIFTSGAKITSVNKWGMDYYGIILSNTKGKMTEVLLDSGNLQAIDRKQHGVNGKFTACGQYVILTPVFASDDWKGKQKLFSLATRELIDIEFPRGFGKYPKVIQHLGNHYWVFLPESKHLAICRQV